LALFDGLRLCVLFSCSVPCVCVCVHIYIYICVLDMIYTYDDKGCMGSYSSIYVYLYHNFVSMAYGNLMQPFVKYVYIYT
jgi:hypothetical protein